MAQKCVKMKMKNGMSKDAAIKACYPDASKMLRAGIKYGLVEEMPAKRKEKMDRKKPSKMVKAAKKYGLIREAPLPSKRKTAKKSK